MSTAGSTGVLAPVDAAFLVSHPAPLVALVGGAGLFPYGPGTLGALVGIPLGLALQAAPAAVALALVAVAFAFGVWACGVTAARSGVHDHPAIVFDETWAMAAVIAFSPPGLRAVLVGFLAFRFFDIVKPWPIGHIDQNVAAGFGIMLDDAVAAVFALALVVGLSRLGWL